LASPAVPDDASRVSDELAVETQTDVGRQSEDKKAPSLWLIDYEYAAYNFRGFDLGNHFCETYIDNAASGDPFFVIDVLSFPTDAAITAFARRYLEHLRGAPSNVASGVNRGDRKSVV
jgi:thiamine kinase-like enzyme